MDEDTRKLLLEQLRDLEEAVGYRTSIVSPEQEARFYNQARLYKNNLSQLWSLLDSGEISNDEFFDRYSRDVFPHLEEANKIKKIIKEVGERNSNWIYTQTDSRILSFSLP